MKTTIAPEQVQQIVNNLNHNPFEILGAHPLEVNGVKGVYFALMKSKTGKDIFTKNPIPLASNKKSDQKPLLLWLI
jgi:hypothetical protein